MSEEVLNRGIGCNVCAGLKVLIGINDIATTLPSSILYFKNIDDTHKYTKASGKRVILKCPNCGTEKEMKINNFYHFGFSCPKCSDKISYPNKIMFSVLEQIGINFESEKVFEWSNNKKYDFYIPLIRCIIEINGLQHYKQSNRGRSLQEEQENDELKRQLAIQNNIEHYIVIDGRKSDFQFIKYNIINSKLSELFDLSNIDWEECFKYTCSSLIKKVCDLWNSGIKNTKNIGEIMKLRRGAIVGYLKTGSILGWTNYNPKEELRKNGKNTSKQVICVTTMETFNSIVEAERKYNLIDIWHNCNNKIQYCGKLPNGDPLIWMYYEDYLNNQNV